MDRTDRQTAGRRLADMLPYDSPMPPDSRKRAWAKAARVAAYAVILGAVVTSVVQYTYTTARNQREEAAFYEKYTNLTPQQILDRGLKPPKGHVGAIQRWRPTIRMFWEGANIYQPRDPANLKEPSLHPNMPFVVILLTPFAYMSQMATAVVLSVGKVLVILASLWMLARVSAHGGRRLPDWVMGLAALWALGFVIGDIRHGNTNVFVLGAIALHLWLYRRGRDLWAGAALALAVCLKMTPALFGVYWLYQRNWKLLAGLVAAMVLFAAVIPASAVGPARTQTLMHDWLGNLIEPGLVKGDWYPINANQSLPGVVGRLTLSGPGGNILWGPDDNTYEEQLREDPSGYWINVVTLQPAQAKWLVRGLQAVLVLLAGWAVGWRKLPRDDGRRMLQWGLVVLLMLLCNQRTWDHHATVLLVATPAAWYAIAFSRCSRRARVAALVLSAAALPVTQIAGLVGLIARLKGAGGKGASFAADVAEAYGPSCLCFLLLFAACIILSVSLRKSSDPYAAERQKLR